MTLGKHVSDRLVYTDEYAGRTIILTSANPELHQKECVDRAKNLGIHLIEVEQDENGRAKLDEIIVVLDQLEINAVYCEGGGTLARSLLVSGNVDYLFKYRSPKIFENKMSLPGPGFEEFPINTPIEQKLGEDLLIHGFL